MGQHAPQATAAGGQIPVVTSILKDFSAEALGELRTWLEQNPPTIPITQISGFQINAAIPTGAVFPYVSVTAPANFLLCDGSSVLQSDYPALFAVISTTYGSVDGTHFTLPDMRGRVPVGYGTHSDVSTLANSDGLAVGSRRAKHKHAVNESPHTHQITSIDAFNHTSSSGATGTAGGDRNLLNITGTGSSVTNLTVGPQTGSEPTDSPAYLVLNYIIKT